MAKKSKYDLIDEEILNYQLLNNTSYVPTDELFSIFQSYLDLPTNDDLRNRYISAKISAYLGKKKNIDGTRKFISTGTGGFSHIEKERDIENLDGALEQMQKREAGINRNIKKIQVRKFFVENQMTIADIVKDEGVI